MREKLRRSYYTIIDRFLAKFDRRFTTNDVLLTSLESFDVTSDLFMDIFNLETFAECYSDHIDDVVLASQVMATKSCGITHRVRWYSE